MNSLLRDLRCAARVLIKSPGFTFATVLTLALSIGANSAVFTVASALLLRPFPYYEPQRLVALTGKDQTADSNGTLLRYELVRDRNQSFQSVAAWTSDNLNLTGRGEPLQVPVARVTSNFFLVLGILPQLGRTFTEAEGRPEGRAVAVLSDSMWRSRFGGISGVLGIGLSWLATRALAAWGASQLPQGLPISIDMRVLLFTLVTSLLTGLFFGVFPAVQLSRVDLNTTLRDAGRTVSGRQHCGWLRSSLVVSQVALSLVLLIGAGLLLHSFGQLLQVDPGFGASDVLTMNVSLSTMKYAKPQKQIDFFDEILRRISVLPGVRSAAMSAALPLSMKRITPVLPEGQPNVPLPQRPFIDIEAITPQWFRTMRVPLHRGREFTTADVAQAPKVIIVNETFARHFWPNSNPVGKHVVVGRGPNAAEVVGIAADVKNQGLTRDTQAQLYLPFPQLPWANMNLLVRTTTPPKTMISSVRAQIYAVDPDQPVTNVRTIDELINESRAEPRFTMLLLGTFSVTALLLAAIGIYGVLAYSMAERKHELGIRMALGADRTNILRLVVRQGLTLAASGIAIGLIAALMLSWLMSSLLFKVGVHDLKTFVLAPMVFLCVALIATFLPAHRATKADPAEVLRKAD